MQFSRAGLLIALAVLLCPSLCRSASAQAPGSACPTSHTTNTTSVCPKISDTTPQVGLQVNATPGEWTGTQPIGFAYQWQRCTTTQATSCQNLPGENEAQYLPAPEEDEGKYLRVVVTAANAEGSATRASAITGSVTPAPSTLPGYNQTLSASLEALAPASLSSPQIGNTLRIADGPGSPASSDGWFNPKASSYVYAWRRCDPDGALESCSTIPGATERAYTLTEADAGHALRARLTGTNAGYSQALLTPPSGALPPLPPANPSSPSLTLPDTVRPVIESLNLAPTAFRATAFGATISAAKGGTKATYVLSEPATATFSIERALSGVKRGKRCVKPPKSATAKAKRCKRYIKAGSFTHRGASGPNSFRFNGRLGRNALIPGSYRLTASAKDSAGNRSLKAATRAFRILPPPTKR